MLMDALTRNKNDIVILDMQLFLMNSGFDIYD